MAQRELANPEAVKLAKDLLTLVNDKTKYSAFQNMVEKRINGHQKILEQPGHTETIYAHHRGCLQELRYFESLKDIVNTTIDEERKSRERERQEKDLKARQAKDPLIQEVK